MLVCFVAVVVNIDGTIMIVMIMIVIVDYVVDYVVVIKDHGLFFATQTQLQ